MMWHLGKKVKVYSLWFLPGPTSGSSLERRQGLQRNLRAKLTGPFRTPRPGSLETQGQRSSFQRSLSRLFFQEGPVTFVEEDGVIGAPRGYILYQSYPNPFNASTAIEYTLLRSARVSLKVYSLLGQEVATLVEGYQEAGSHRVRWDGLDREGRPVSSGTYLYRLQAGGFEETKSMTLLR
ncbi:MAG TPA: T9SS type A sorting domain-containing protein [Anaerolineae bacterium]|nr:T9SS type A sorting domain-containing protein [Anaerolineae bacterium]